MLTAETSSSTRVAMPRVTLYVKDSDAPIWDRARALVSGSDEDSLSALVTECLAAGLEKRERALKVEKSISDQLENIELVGVNAGTEQPRRIRFKGFLAHESEHTSVYVTKGKQIILEGTQWPTSEITVFESFDELREAVERGGAWPAGMMEDVAEAIGEEYFEELE